MSLQVYGIPNCGTCKKSFKWLQDNGVDYEFINTKEKPPTREIVESWVGTLGAKSMRNTSGQSYRALGDEKQTWTDERWIDTKSGLTTPFIRKDNLLEMRSLPGDMVKKAHLQPYLTSNELKTRYLCSSDRVESRRWHLLWLVSKQWTIQQASLAVGLNYDYAKDIVKAYNQQGEKAMANRRRQRTAPPCHALLNREQLEQLRSSLKQQPEDKGIWTGPKVADWIAKKTGREKVWPQRGWDYLKKCRYSAQRPRPRHAKADPEAQQEFKKNCKKKLENCNENSLMR